MDLVLTALRTRYYPVQSAGLIDHRGALVSVAFARQLSWGSALCFASDGAINHLPSEHVTEGSYTAARYAFFALSAC